MYYLWITNWSSWSRLSKWMSAHGLDLKFETHVLVLPVISVFIFKKVFLYFLFDLFLSYSFCYGTDPPCLRTSHLHFLFIANHL